MKKTPRHIHLLGICGTGMASLAGLLKEMGLLVTGSDKAAYPPMNIQLEKLGIRPKIGFDPANLVPRPDLAIIGNVITRDNPEAKAVIEERIPYMSMPEALSEMFLKDRESIVVTGTHGKTTTANIIAWLLEEAGKKPSFLIGGVGLNFGRSYRLADGKYFVIEGDEYDTAFFDKGPKFLHYRPKYAIINPIEFDHADIYKDLDQIKSSFRKFINIIPKDGIVVVNSDSPTAIEIAKHSQCRTLTCGYSQDSDYIIKETGTDGEATRFTISRDGKEDAFQMALSGRHNISNAAASIALLLEAGLKGRVLARGLGSFRGVKRRQEIRGCVGTITVIDDFAHHPTAILETIKAMRKRYPGSRIVAVFEPRSNTTRRKVFETELGASLATADISILAEVFHSSDIDEADRLDPQKVINIANSKGGKAAYIAGVEDIIDSIVANALPNDVVLIMSNGAFDNIHERLLDRLDSKQRDGK